MQTRTVEQVESWDARPFSGGFRELQELADEDFSGAVVADDTWTFFLNGRVIGVFQGDIDDVADASGSIYQAPDPSLPLLFTMQERGGRTQAKYFTNDTSIEEADATLRDANFTGYLELSENVLSGDYYVSYYGGKSMSTAFIGQSERLVTGEEAFEKANDEVGVFEVRKVSMNITEIPTPVAEQPDATDAGASGAAAADESGPDETAAANPTSAVDSESPEAADTASSESTPAASESEPATASAPSEDATESTTAEKTSATDPTAAETTSADGATASEGDTRSTTPAEDPSEAAASSRTDSDGQRSADIPDAEQSASTPEESRDGAGHDVPSDESVSDHERAVREWAKKDRDPDAETAENEDLFREEAEWRESAAIPALDPDESGPTESEDSRQTAQRSRRRPDRSRTEPRERQRDQSSQTANRGSGRRSAQSRSQSTGTASDRAKETISKLESAVEERERRIEELESERDAAQSEREDLEATVSDLRTERDELQRRVDELESDLAAAQADSASADNGPGDLGPETALAGTNLFVRYDSKGKPTLSSISEGSVDPEAVNDNLRLEHHTQFDLEDATVNGEPFEQFLHDSGRYRFVEWVVRALPYELLDSAATTELQDVYDAVPAFDRIEFDGVVDVEDDDGESVRHEFDVVVRDRMGEPLVVAEINASRDPVHEDAMEGLVTGATAIGEAVESLAGAFYVTSSFFEPGALERAQEAASAGGFFGRSDRESYVKVSRKRGYHLCLVEDRHDAFHLTVPEL